MNRTSIRSYLAVCRALLALCVVVVGVRAVEAADDKAKAAPPALPKVDRPVDFVKDIQPIFEAACYKCHGAEKHKGDLRLDSKPLALRGGVTGELLVAGNGDKSLLVHRLLGLGDEDVMPLKADALPPAQIALVKAWIDQGAKWPDSAANAEATLKKHWAYEKPVRPAVPAVKDAAWVRNPIDAFILARLEKEGLRPSAEAGRETLIRRVSFDLIGLPPSPKEVDEFVNDTRPDAYERLVDRLLASPHYGERWARPWLDLARYADSKGFEKDAPRVMWRYRDWVINALNANMPFSHFTIEQIAGDMLPGATADQKIATGFHRNTMQNEEGGVDPEEARWTTLVDRVGTTGEVWLGTTLACAQCHNHKYDPISQKEFYQFLAFFDNAAEPTLNVPAPASPEQEKQRKDAEAQIAKLEQVLNAPTPELAAAQEKWEKLVGAATAWRVLDLGKFTASNGTVLTKQVDGSILAGGTIPAKEVYTVVARTDLKSIGGFRLEVLPHDALRASGPGAAENGNFVLSDFKVALAKGDGGKPLPAKLTRSAADFSQDGWPVAHAIDNKKETGWAISPQFGKEHAAVFATGTPLVGFDGGTTLTFTLEQQSIYPQHNIGRFRLSVTDSGDPFDKAAVPEKVKQTLAVAPAARGEAQKHELAAYYRSIAPELKATRDQVAALRKGLEEKKGKADAALVFQEKPGNARPATDLRIRGSYLQKGERVEADVPKVLPPLPKGEAPNRLALARWLASDKNPLTARVTVNRFWEQVFGHGIVETVSDFGSQGEVPSHPELLDWLATEFTDRNWDVKATLRLIVTSNAYRQTSKVTPPLLEKDPYNRLIARGPRFRMEAEMLRDGALAVSGQLSRKVGGPSVMPYQPEGIWDIPYSGDRWVQSKGEDAFRRGLYTFWRRSAPYPTFMAFDAPSREFCTVRRLRTNTPLQALSVLNDPAFFDAARALARRMVAEAPSADTGARAAYGFRLCTARAPRPQELKALTDLFEQQLQSYRKDATAASTLAGSQPVPQGTQPPEIAAWTVVANILLNLDETVTKE